jgi:WD40 repeat protein
MLDPFHKEGEVLLPKVLFSLNAHESRINSVQWICPGVLVSVGGDDHSIVFWKNQRVLQAQSNEDA